MQLAGKRREPNLPVRTLLTFLLCGLLSSTPLLADFSYESRIRITGGELYDALGKLGPHGRDPVIVTKLIRGRRMAILSRRHTTVIDLDAATPH